PAAAVHHEQDRRARPHAGGQVDVVALLRIRAVGDVALDPGAGRQAGGVVLHASLPTEPVLRGFGRGQGGGDDEQEQGGECGRLHGGTRKWTVPATTPSPPAALTAGGGGSAGSRWRRHPGVHGC